ncbi:MAG: L,D-transpeptidase [Nitrospira sp.]|nr:MAG: L,D-transpeptidase [Nitrospira sp.]
MPRLLHLSYWIHGRDLPGYPASHGCIGLYNEPMQKEQYGIPKEPELEDAKRLFECVLSGEVENARMIPLIRGPKVHIIGLAPRNDFWIGAHSSRVTGRRGHTPVQKRRTYPCQHPNPTCH